MKIIGLGLDMAGTPLFPAQDEYMVADSPVQSLVQNGPEERKSKLLDRWITRGDAQDYMVIGDRGARLRLPA